MNISFKDVLPALIFLALGGAGLVLLALWEPSQEPIPVSETKEAEAEAMPLAPPREARGAAATTVEPAERTDGGPSPGLVPQGSTSLDEQDEARARARTAPGQAEPERPGERRAPSSERDRSQAGAESSAAAGIAPPVSAPDAPGARDAALPGVYVPAATAAAGGQPEGAADPSQSAAAGTAARPVDAESPTPGSEQDVTDSGEAERPQTPGPDDSTPPALVQMGPSSGELFVGDRLSVVVQISSATDVGHVPFHVRFNPEVLQFESGEEGPFLGSDGVQTAFFASLTTSGDTVVVGLSRLGQIEGINGGGVLCTLHFVSIGPGGSDLTFDRAKIRDSSNDVLPGFFQGTVVVVR